MGKRTYSDEEKADALLQLDANGGNLKRTAVAIGIPRKTLAEWRDGHVHHAVAEIRHDKRPPLADRLEALAHLCLDLLPGKLDAASAAQVSVSLGISLEKMRLLRNESTAHVKHEDDLPDAERVDRIAALADQARTRRAGQPAQDVAVN
jgi:transposase-like protein